MSGEGDISLFNREAEALLIAGVLRHPEAYWSITECGVTGRDFGVTEARTVFSAIEAVANNRNEPDLALVVEELRRRGMSSSEAYLDKVRQLPCSTAQAIDYAKTVRGLATSRALQDAGVKIIEVARDKRSDADAAIVEAQSLIRKVSLMSPQMERSPDPADIIADLKSSGPEYGIPIRFMPTLQEMTGGMVPGHVWIVGGFSSTGKSAFATNMMLDVIKAKKWVGLISTEMTREQYMIRLLSIVSGVPQKNIRDRVAFSQHDIDALEKAEKYLAVAPVRMFDTVYNIKGIRSQAQKMSQTTGLDVLFVDFLQNVSGSHNDEVKDAREVIIELQRLAKELRCTVVAFSQISNEMAKMQAETGASNYYSFKGHGALRDACDIGIMLSRDRLSHSPALIVQMVKNRHYEMATIQTTMHLPTGKIEEESVVSRE